VHDKFLRASLEKFCEPCQISDRYDSPQAYANKKIVEDWSENSSKLLIC